MASASQLDLVESWVRLDRNEIALPAGKTKDGEPREIPISHRLRTILLARTTTADGEQRPGHHYVFGDDLANRVKSIKRAWHTAVLRAHGHKPVWIWRKKGSDTKGTTKLAGTCQAAYAPSIVDSMTCDTRCPVSWQTSRNEEGAGGSMQTRILAMRKRVSGIVMLALLGAATVVGRGLSPVPAAQDWDKVPVKAVRVAGGVYLLTGAGGNVGVLPGEDGVLLVDSMFPQLHDKIVAALSSLSGGGHVRYILNTNWHYDHALGNELFRKDGAVIIGHVNCVARMGREQFHDVLNERTAPYPASAWPEVTFTDSLGLRFNREDIQVLHIPSAHSDADAIFIFKKANVIHTGDAFFSAGYPYIDITNGGSIDGMIAASDRVLALANPDTLLIPGHGPVADRARLQQYRAMLGTVRDRVAKLAGEGTTLEQTVAAKPTADLDAEWTKGTGMPPDGFVALVYKSLPPR